MVNWSAEILNNTYKKAENFTAKQREFVRLAAYNKLRPDENNIYVTYSDWMKKPSEEKRGCALLRFGTAANPIVNKIQTVKKFIQKRRQDS